MIRYKFIVLLVLLPLLVNSKNVKPRRRPFLEPVSSTQHPLLDQIALADSSWEAPNKILPAAYHGDLGSGHNDQANLVINVVPQHKRPAEVDIVASQALANAKTAQEYVNRAIEMRNKYETTPSSSFVKYDIFENVETKQHATPASQIEVPIPKKTVTEVSKKSSLDYEFDEYRRPDYLKQLNFNKDQEPAFSNFHESYLPEALDVYQEDKSHLFKKKVPPSSSSYPSKDEVLGTIEKSVLKYMQQLEADGRILGIANRPTAHTEIKTYYRFPTATVPSPVPSQTSSNIVNTGTHSEFFKSPKGVSVGSGSNKIKYATIKPFSADTYLPETVDLTFPSNKKRPKPLDLSALDVGQTWLHTNEPPPRKPNPKPKLHFNSQSYQDINSLSYPPNGNKGLFDDDNVPYSSGTWSEQDPYGASDDSLKASPNHYVPAVQILNGVPVSNPYKFHIDTLNDIFENGHKPSSHENSYGENSWSPLYDNPNAIRDSYHPAASGSNYNLQYDSYGPKYNSYLDDYAWNKNHRQRGSHGHGLIDMFTSGTANRPKKVLVGPPKVAVPKRPPSKQKVKAKIRPAKRPINPTTRERDSDLSRELSPPPPE